MGEPILAMSQATSWLVFLLAIAAPIAAVAGWWWATARYPQQRRERQLDEAIARRHTTFHPR